MKTTKDIINLIKEKFDKHIGDDNHFLFVFYLDGFAYRNEFMIDNNANSYAFEYGKTIIQWVYEKAQQAKLADMIIVATDDQRIYDCVKGFGGNVEMTSVDHKCGSDRIMEVVSRHPEISFICNLQGDEPLIKSESIAISIV